MTMFNTLLLDAAQWDLVIDSSNNIAMAEPPYAVSQDVASAVRLFLGELWFDTTRGIPYWTDVLGHMPPASLLCGYIERAALTVPGVVKAQCVITSFTDRSASGTLQFTDESGGQNSVSF